MREFTQRLELAMLQGAALATLTLASCSGRAVSTTPASGEQTASQPSGGEGGQANPDLPSAREPYPVEGVACTGKDYGDGPGYHGQCCATAACYTPPDDVCVASDDAPAALGLSFGSGRCLCGAIEGPFAPNPAADPSRPGDCCYLLPSMGCDGRPLLVDGAAVVSAPVARRDWLSSELLSLLVG